MDKFDKKLACFAQPDSERFLDYVVEMMGLSAERPVNWSRLQSLKRQIISNDMHHEIEMRMNE